jgi:hypothetical protein
MNNEDEFPDGYEQALLPFDPPLEEKPAAKPGEIETLRLEISGLRHSLRLAEARNEMTPLLRSAGARSPELLFEAAGKLMQFADDGTLQNAESISAELKHKFPEQFAGTSAQPTIDAGAGSTVFPHALTRETLAKMKPAEVARLNWDDVRQVLAS